MSEHLVKNNEARSRFEVEVDGEIAELTYRLQPDSISFLHTGVPKKLSGHGLGQALVRTGLDFARERKLSVIPLCPFVADYIQRHPEYLDIVDEDYRADLSA